ncbi:MAG: ABC transporter permease [Campylobacteraceae bacterium]|nr:ABC transporter permease [Campylobacteraceae bacterium]
MPEKKEVEFRAKGFVYKKIPFLGAFAFIVLIVLLEIGTRYNYISDLTLPRPSGVFTAFVELYDSGLLFEHLIPSFTRLIVGSCLGIFLGIIIGVLIALFSTLRASFLPLISALFPVPKIALLPLFVIWFGIDEGSKYALIALGTFTPTVIATYAAVDNVDRNLIRMGQSFGLSWMSIVKNIILPGSLPGILSGIRISLAIGIILLVAAEMLGASYGIGAYVLEAGSLYDLERLFVGVSILSAMGVFLSYLVALLEKKLLSWRN